MWSIEQLEDIRDDCMTDINCRLVHNKWMYEYSG